MAVVCNQSLPMSTILVEQHSNSLSQHTCEAHGTPASTCQLPVCNSGEADYPSLSMSSHAPEMAGDVAARARVYQGGTYLDLHKMLGVSSGSQVLPREPSLPSLYERFINIVCGACPRRASRPRHGLGLQHQAQRRSWHHFCSGAVV